MGSPPTRRDFLRKGTATIDSDLAASPAVAVEMPASGRAKQEDTRRRHSKSGLSSSGEIDGVGSAEELKRFAQDPSKQLPKNLQWYAETFVRARFDLGASDSCPEALSKLDIKDLVPTLFQIGLELLTFYGQDPSGWLFYASKLDHKHPNLNGRDVVAECAAACHNHRFRFLGYFVPNEMCIEVTCPPKSRVERADSPDSPSPRLRGNLSFNHPICWDFFLGMVRQAVSCHETDLILFDGS